MGVAKIETWIKEGYELLAIDGMEGIKVERLARNLALNKSGFYHYFKTMELFVKSLLRHHVHLAQVIAVEIARCENIDPDLMLLVVKNKTFFLAESQLLVKSRLLFDNDDVDEAGKIMNAALIPLWRKTSELPEDSAISLAYLNIVRHFLYARINPENLSYEFLHALAVDTKDVLYKVIMEKYVSSNVTQTPLREKISVQ